MRKTLLLLMAFTLFFAFSAGAVDARPKFGGIKSPKKSYTTTPSKPAENVNKSTPGTAHQNQEQQQVADFSAEAA